MTHLNVLIPLPASKPDDPRYQRATARVELWKGDIHLITEDPEGNEDDRVVLDPYWARVFAVEILARLQELDSHRRAEA